MTLSRRHNYEAWLVPYAEGTLDPARAALLEARLARDPRLAAQAEAVRAVTARLHQAAAQSRSDPDPRAAFRPVPLWPGVQKRLAPLPVSPFPQPLRWAGGACALALGALLLHSALFGLRTRHTVMMPAQVARQDIALTSPAETAVPARQKKAGRRTHSRPAPFALHPFKARPSALLAVRPALPLPVPDSSETPLPAPAVPAARAAVALGEGTAHFRLASPVSEEAAEHRLPPGLPAARNGEDTLPAQGETLTSDTNSPQNAPAPDTSVPTSAAPPLATIRSARTKHRHHPHRSARTPAAPTTGTSAPAAAPPSVPAPTVRVL